MKLIGILVAAALGTTSAQLARSNAAEFENVLTKLAAPNLSTAEQCDVCQAACNLVDKELALASKTWSDIRDSVLERCDKINSDFVQQQCNVVMNKLDKIATLVEQKLEPSDICVKVGLCQNDELLATQLPKEICEDCEAARFMASSTFIKAVKPVVNFVNPEFVCHNMALVDDKKHPGMSKMFEICKEYITVVKDSLSKTLHMVENYDGCNVVLDCPATQQVYDLDFSFRGAHTRHIATMPKFLCQACERVNDVVKNFLQNFVDNWPQVKAQVEQQCEQMGDKADMCKQGLQQLDEIVSTMKSQLPTLNICEKFDCEAGKSLVSHNDVHEAMLGFHRSQGRHLVTSEELNSESMICDRCFEGEELIKHAIEQVQREWPNVRSQMKQGCSSAFGAEGPASAVCEKVLVTLDKIVPELDNYLAPITQLCEKAGCENADNSLAIAQAVDEEEAIEMEDMPEFVCDACDKAESFVHSVGSKTQEQWPAIREQISTACENLGQDTLVSVCNQGLAKLDEAVKQIDDKLLNANVCAPLGCESNTDAPIAFDVASVDGAPKVACEACKFGVDLLQGVVDALEQQWPEYRDELTKKCAAAGDDNLVSLCKDGVQDLDMIVSALKDQISGLDLCKELQCEEITAIA